MAQGASPGCPQRGHGHVLEVLTRVQTSLDHIENAGRHGRETKHVLNRQEVNDGERGWEAPKTSKTQIFGGSHNLWGG